MEFNQNTIQSVYAGTNEVQAIYANYNCYYQKGSSVPSYAAYKLTVTAPGMGVSGTRTGDFLFYAASPFTARSGTLYACNASVSSGSMLMQASSFPSSTPSASDLTIVSGLSSLILIVETNYLSTYSLSSLNWNGLDSSGYPDVTGFDTLTYGGYTGVWTRYSTLDIT